MMHAFADGNCYMPLVQDLMALYEAARRGVDASLSVPPMMGRQAFGILQRRLFDTLQCCPNPSRSSLRGSLFRYVGRGYGQSFALLPGAVAALSQVAAHYRVPLDIVFLGLVVCCMARVDRTNLVEFTLYAPMRDGAAEVMMIGLFADWRDIVVSVDYELATLLGTLLQITHMIQNRQWKPFNALKKPESMVVNIQPLDMERRSHFQHLGENLWVGGDRLKTPPRRGEEMPHVRQQATFNIEQQDESTWWILCDVGNHERPPAWMRRFAYSLRQCIEDLMFNPLAPVHRPIPNLDRQAVREYYQ